MQFIARFLKNRAIYCTVFEQTQASEACVRGGIVLVPLTNYTRVREPAASDKAASDKAESNGLSVEYKDGDSFEGESRQFFSDRPAYVEKKDNNEKKFVSPF